LDDTDFTQIFIFLKLEWICAPSSLAAIKGQYINVIIKGMVDENVF